MSREIKFRGLRVGGKNWVHGDLCQLFSKDSLCIMPDSFYGTKDFSEVDDDDKPVLSDSLAIGGFYPVVKESVGQFTGRHDKNGKEIYDGDWLRVCAGYSSRVEWSNEQCAFLSIYTHPEDGEELLLSDLGNEIEVIGNIHEEEGEKDEWRKQGTH